MSRGVIYVAFGERYVKEACFSAASVKKHCVNLSIILYTDVYVECEHFSDIVIIEPTHKFAKVDFIPNSPFDETLFLDSDTQVLRDISDIFEVLERFDIAAAHDHGRKSSRWSNVIPEYSEIPYAFAEYNTGVFAYKKNDRTAEFFKIWLKYFYRYKEQSLGQDQPSFRIAVWKSEISVHVLPFEYNVRNQAIRNKMDKRSQQPDDEGLLKPRILHWHGLTKKRTFSKLRARYRPMKF